MPSIMPSHEPERLNEWVALDRDHPRSSIKYSIKFSCGSLSHLLFTFHNSLCLCLFLSDSLWLCLTLSVSVSLCLSLSHSASVWLYNSVVQSIWFSVCLSPSDSVFPAFPNCILDPSWETEWRKRDLWGQHVREALCCYMFDNDE